MTSLSFLDFVGVRITIGALRSIAPGSAVYLLFCATKPQYFNTFLALYAVAEFLFYLLIYLPRRATLQAPSKYLPQPLTQAERRLLISRCIESIQHDVTDMQYPICWFLPRHSRPKREDVVDWLLWSFFNTSRQRSDVRQYEDELHEYIETIEKALGAKFEVGHSEDGTVHCMRIHLDLVDMLHRPLLWYLIVGLVDLYTSVTLLVMGFKHYTPRESQWRRTFPPRPFLSFISHPAPGGAVFPYWHRPHKSSTKLPLLFLHGIGVGWFTYIPFLRIIINDDPDVGILLPEFMSICMHITPQSVPPLPLFLASLDLVLESLSTVPPAPYFIPHSQQPSYSISPEKTETGSRRPWDRVVLMGHSYGTFILGWILRKTVDVAADSHNRLTNKIAHVVLVDPVPILLCNAILTHNFLYRSPSTVCPHRLGSIIDDANFEDHNGYGSNDAKKPYLLEPAFYSSPAAWQFWYFASRDPDVARTLFRTLFWTEGVIWRDDITAFITGCLVDDVGNLTIDPHSSKERVCRNMAVVLEGLDQVVPAQGIRRYLTRKERPTAHWSGRVRVHQDGQFEIRPSSEDEDDSYAIGGNLEVLYHPRLDHSDVFKDPKRMMPLVAVVQRYTRGG